MQTKQRHKNQEDNHVKGASGGHQFYVLPWPHHPLVPPLKLKRNLICVLHLYRTALAVFKCSSGGRIKNIIIHKLNTKQIFRFGVLSACHDEAPPAELRGRCDNTSPASSSHTSVLTNTFQDSTMKNNMKYFKLKPLLHIDNIAGSQGSLFCPHSSGVHGLYHKANAAA